MRLPSGFHVVAGFAILRRGGEMVSFDVHMVDPVLESHGYRTGIRIFPLLF